jgi:hypothetical protein
MRVYISVSSTVFTLISASQSWRMKWIKQELKIVKVVLKKAIYNSSGVIYSGTLVYVMTKNDEVRVDGLSMKAQSLSEKYMVDKFLFFQIKGHLTCCWMLFCILINSRDSFTQKKLLLKSWIKCWAPGAHACSPSYRRLRSEGSQFEASLGK